MRATAPLERLLRSERWLHFQESTAAGLQLHLSTLVAGSLLSPGVPAICPLCRVFFAPLTAADVSQALAAAGNGTFATAGDLPAVAVPLRAGVAVVVRECSCGAESVRPSLAERAGVARNLLSSFLGALAGELAEGQRAGQLSALRQINQITIALFRGDGKAGERALNLLLSALVILLEARGSWLEYQDSSGMHRMVRGDAAAVQAHLERPGPGTVTAAVPGTGLPATLGILAPADREQADILVPLMAHEVQLVFEIERLFQLLQNQLARVLGAVSSAVLLVDQQGLLTYANGTAERMLGRRALELVGQPTAAVAAPWTAALRTRPSRRVSGQMDPLTPQADRWVDWQVNPLFDGLDRVGWLVMADDRTDHRRWQLAARQAERLAATATLVRTLAHEVRNPLAATRGLLDVAGRRPDPEKLGSYMELAVRELDRVDRLLGEFLLLGKPARVRPESVELADFLHELLPLLEGEAAGTQVGIRLDLHPASPVVADLEQLTQATLNLVRNAVEAVRPRGHVTVTLRESDGWVCLAVRDDGPGLPPEVMDHLFLPFFTTKERGSGLGLAITQAIVQNHGGQVMAANAQEGGTVFSMLLPIPNPTTGAPPAVDVLICLADDLLRYPSEQVLRAAGLRILSAGDPTSAVGLAERYHPAVVLADAAALDAPALQHLRQALPRIKLLVVGNPEGAGNEENLVFVPRSFDFAWLVSRVRSLLMKSDVH